MPSQAKRRIDWARLDWLAKFRTAVGMLAIALVAIAAVLGVVGFRTSDQTVQIIIVSACVLSLLAFLAASVWMVKQLGALALAEGSDLRAMHKTQAATGEATLNVGSSRVWPPSIRAIKPRTEQRGRVLVVPITPNGAGQTTHLHGQTNAA